MDSHLIANNPTSGHPPHYKRSYPSHLTSELNIIRSTGEHQCNLTKNLRSAHHPSLMINLTTPKSKSYTKHTMSIKISSTPHPPKKNEKYEKILTNEKKQN